MSYEDTWEFRASFLQVVYKIARTYGGSVTSWVRSEAHNRAVGGHPHSRHLIGLAVDMVFDSLPEQEAAVKMALSCDLHVMVEVDHVHIQAVPVAQPVPLVVPGVPASPEGGGQEGGTASPGPGGPPDQAKTSTLS